MQHIGNLLRNYYIIGPDSVSYSKNGTICHIACEIAPVKIASYPFKNNSLDIFISFNNTRLCCKYLDMLNSGYFFYFGNGT